MFRVSKLILIAALIAAPALADRDDRYEQNVDRTMTYRGGRIAIDHSFGPIDLHTTTGDTITLHAKIRSSDPDIGRQISVEISPATSAGVTIRTHYPEIHWHGGSISYSVDLDVTVPANAPLMVKNKFGSIDASGVRASSEFTNAQGSIEARDFSGQQRIETVPGFGPAGRTPGGAEGDKIGAVEEIALEQNNRFLGRGDGGKVGFRLRSNRLP